MSDNFSWWPLLTLKERDRRWKALRGMMADAGIDALIVHGTQDNWGGNLASLRYISGIGDFGWCVFPQKGEPIYLTWWTAPMDAFKSPEVCDLTKEIWSKVKKRDKVRNPWALEQAWMNDVRQGYPNFATSIIQAISDLELTHKSLGIVGAKQNWEPEGFFPLETYNKLVRELPHANFCGDYTWMIEKLRLCKGPEEIACIEKAAIIADEGIKTLVEKARPGVPEASLYADILATLLKEGSERMHVMYWASGPAPNHVRSFAPTDRIMHEGDVIFSEITPRYGGYVAHPHQPVIIGKAIPEYIEMFNLLKKTFDDALAKLKPGVTMKEQVELLTKPLEEAGYSYLHCPFHGMGLSGLEWPNAPFVNGSEPITASPPDMKFEEGMLLAYEPMISTADRRISLPLGDTVLVTKDGARRLSKFVNELIIS